MDGWQVKSQLDARELALLDSEVRARAHNPVIAYLLILFGFGGIGAHRFYLGHRNAGIAYLVTFSIGLVLTIVLVGFVVLLVLGAFVFADLFRIPRWVDAERRSLEAQIGSWILSQRGGMPGYLPLAPGLPQTQAAWPAPGQPSWPAPKPGQPSGPAQQPGQPPAPPPGWVPRP